METFLSSLNNGELNAIKRELSNSRSILQPKFLIISNWISFLPSLLPSQKSDSKQILVCEERRVEERRGSEITSRWVNYNKVVWRKTGRTEFDSKCFIVATCIRVFVSRARRKYPRLGGSWRRRGIRREHPVRGIRGTSRLFGGTEARKITVEEK